MSEIDLTKLAGVREDVRDMANTKIIMREYDVALKECGFGKFQVYLLTSAMMAYMAGVLVSSGTSYLLTSAECDLGMTLLEKGFLNAVPYIGMIFSSMLAGILTDIFGRKIFLSIGFGGIFIANIIAGFSQTYEVLIAAKFFEGLLFAVSFNPLVTLTAEFAHSGIRDRVMVLQASMIPVGMIITSLFSWPVFIQEWEYSIFGGYIVLHTWNFYIYICSTFSFAAFIMYQFVPESPKYLISHGNYDKARTILAKVYTMNTGKLVDTFKYHNIWKNRPSKDEQSITPGWRHQIVAGIHAVKPMFRKPLLSTLVLLCSMNTLNMLMYNTLRLWYPQLSTIIEHYSHGPGKDLCNMLDEYTADLNMNTSSTSIGECIQKKSGNETYINSIILGLICLIPFIISGFLIDKVGKKCIMLVCSILCCAVTVSMKWASSKLLLVSMFGADVAFTQIMMGMYQNVVVEFFPTAYRTLAVATIMTCGRFGTLLGNIAFPILLNMGCVVPFFTLAAMMACIFVLAVFLPSKKS